MSYKQLLSRAPRVQELTVHAAKNDTLTKIMCSTNKKYIMGLSNV